MFGRIRVTMLAASAAGVLLAVLSSTAHAGLLSLNPGACGLTESQPFAPWGDYNTYVQVPGGTFEPGSASWALSGGAKVVSGNESYNASGSYSLSLPAGSSATSPGACTGLDHPSARLFVRNTGSSSSRLNVYATYRILLGLPVKVYLGQLTGSAGWEPSAPVDMGLLNNLAGELTLSQSTISFTFVPADSTGKWQIDDVYLDPWCRNA